MAGGRALHDLLDRHDQAALALALSGAWQYAKVPCPRVVLYPVYAGAERVVLLTRLLFACLPAGGSLTTEELDSMAAAARHAVVMRGRGSATATAELAPAADVDQLGAHALEYGEHSPEIAERDWWRPPRLTCGFRWTRPFSAVFRCTIRMSPSDALAALVWAR
ncbi:hypothetical protein AB0J35_56985 [Nonomuraea angiospora]|uniref:hypothetical protein n=1 Tax=Nonomuraea angiospora TaxID=46172 RepID=UPI00341AF0A7